MPLTGVMFASAGAEVVGGDGRAGDVRGHIFRIDAQHGSVTQMVTSAGDRVATDAQGRAAVTLDFVCLRCHNGKGNAFLLTPSGATEIAPHMHVNAGATP
jgi:type IV secretory pathway TrbL component